MLHDATTPVTGRTQQRAARYMRIALRLVVTGIVLCGLLAAVSRIVQPKNNQAEFGQSDSEAHGVLASRAIASTSSFWETPSRFAPSRPCSFGASRASPPTYAAQADRYSRSPALCC